MPKKKHKTQKMVKLTKKPLLKSLKLPVISSLELKYGALVATRRLKKLLITPKVIATVLGLMVLILTFLYQFKESYLVSYFQDKAKIVFLVTNMGYTGTGFHLTAENGKTYIITNAHICDTASNGGLVIQYREKTAFRRILKISSVYDLCAVETMFSDGVSSIADPSRMFPYAISLGYGRASDITLKTGVYNSRFRQTICEKQSPLGGCLKIRPYILDSYIYTVLKGDSGSPVFNSFGSLIGVINATDTMKGYAVPTEHLKKFMESL